MSEKYNSLNEMLCGEFTDPDGKVRLNTKEKVTKMKVWLNERGYKTLGETNVRILPQNALVNIEKQA